MFLEEIVSDALTENSEIECKSKLDRNNVVGWLKTFAGFANADGGTLYVGVEDKTNKLIGFDRSAADSERNYFKGKPWPSCRGRMGNGHPVLFLRDCCKYGCVIR